MSDITTTLKQFNLSDNEVRIYLSLLQTGPSSIQSISRATLIPRSTVYQRIESLLDKGFLVEEVGEKGQIVRAINPSNLREIVDKRVKKSRKLKHNFESILPELTSLYKPASSKTKVMHFIGIEGLQRMIYNHEMEAENKNIYGYTTNQISDILGQNFIWKYHEKFLKKGYTDHFIMSKNKKNKEYFDTINELEVFKKGKIRVRTLPEKTFNPKVTVSIYDDKYAIAQVVKGKPFGVIIQNEEIVKHQMEIFNILWKTAEPLEIR
jgi:sugar-specific transcriptional regulator TrmB